MQKNFIYLDYNATTPAKPAVARAVAAVMERPLNASSVHGAGREAKRLIDGVRRTLSAALGAENYNVVFTASGTEANNLALKGIKADGVLVSSIEHASVLNAMADAVKIPVDENGVVELAGLQRLLSNYKQPLVSVMLANNETGVIQPIKDITALVHAAGGIMHTDAVQAFGKINVDISTLNVDLITVSAHKIGGPLGAAALLVKPGVMVQPQIVGGGQELGMRAGTENVPAIVGFGTAIENIQKSAHTKVLRDRMETVIKSLGPETIIFGEHAERLPNTSCFTMPGVKNETQLIHFDLAGIAVSAGSACSSGKVTVSHVLKAMGADNDIATTSIRVSLGAETTERDMDQFVTAWRALFDRTANQRRAA